MSKASLFVKQVEYVVQWLFNIRVLVMRNGSNILTVNLWRKTFLSLGDIEVTVVDSNNINIDFSKRHFASGSAVILLNWVICSLYEWKWEIST